MKVYFFIFVYFVISSFSRSNDLKSRFNMFNRTRSHHNLEPARLDNTIHIQIKKRKFVWSDDEIYPFALTRSECDALEILQLQHRPRHRTDEIADVKLHDLISRNLTCVCHLYADFRSICRPNLCGCNFQIRVLEGRIAQAKPEGKERLLACEQVTPPGGWLVVVCDRQLTDRAWETNRQFARRIVIAKYDVCHCLSGLLPEIKTFEDGRDFLRDIVDRQWTAVDQDDHRWFASLQHRFDKVVLLAYQIQTIAITEVVIRPAFFICIFIAAQDQQGKVRRFRNLDRFGDQFDVLSRIAQVCFVRPPVASFFSNPAAGGMCDFDLSRYLLGDSLQHADTTTGIVAVSPEMHAVGIGPDDGDRFQAITVEW